MLSEEDFSVRIRGSTHPQVGKTPKLRSLLSKLKTFERQEQTLPSARLAAKIANYFRQTGAYRTSAYWLDWSLQLYEAQPSLSAAYWQTFREWLVIKLLLGEVQAVETKLQRYDYAERSALSFWSLSGAQLQVDLYKGRLEDALQTSRALWEGSSQRQTLPDLANIYVRALLAQEEKREAQRVAEQLSCLMNGLNYTCQAKALFLKSMVQHLHDPASANATLLEVRRHLPFPWTLQADLMLLRIYECLGDTLQAHRELNKIVPLLKEVRRDGLVFLLGPWVLQSPSLSFRFRSGLELRLLGTPKVHLQNETLTLRPRFAELLAVLAAHPEGMSKAELSLAVYGESYDSSCCKTEINRLKQLVPLKSQPYRLDAPVWADFLELLTFIEADQVDKAIDLYGGPFLAYSDAPEVCRWRDVVNQALCNAALDAPSPEPLWKLANKMRDDLTLWEGMLTRLPSGDPRQALAQAHVHSLRRSWGLG